MLQNYVPKHTDEEYEKWGRAIGSEDWKNLDNNLDDVSLVARIIYAEEKTREGQNNVAKELHNRMAQWTFANGKGLLLRKEEKYKYTWKGIIYAGESYTPIVDPKSSGGPLNPYMETHIDSGTGEEKPDDEKNKWRIAADCAWEVVHNANAYVLLDNVLITSQLFHTGYSGRPDRMAEILLSYNSTTTTYPDGKLRNVWIVDPDNPDKNRYNVVPAGETLFYHDIKTVDIPPFDLLPTTGTGGENNSPFPIFNASEFVDFLKSRVGCGYVLGTYGQICTQQLLENRAVADPENGASYYLGDCSRWIGKLVTDCSGLIEWFLLKKGVTNYDSYSGGIYKSWCHKTSTDITTMPRVPGTLVFKRNSKGIYHVGVFIGNDRVIEAKGAMYGVVVTQYSADATWNAWGSLSWLANNIGEEDVSQPPLVMDALTYGPLPGYADIRSSENEMVSHSGSYNAPVYHKGDSGSKIEMVRRRLWAESSSFAVNNLFDDALEAKIIAFQTANGITADGTIGSVTWKALFPVLKKKAGSQPGAKAMQALLNYQNFRVGTPDGLFGTGTETVLKAYQTARQLDSDGICGEKTWESLTLEEPYLEEVIIDQNGDYTAICKMGDSNDLVKQLQARLALQYNLAVTGVYDAATDAKVIAYQNANGITANGNVGSITWKKLFPVLKVGRGTTDEVRALQMLLCTQNHLVLVDGIFGSGTLAAVKAYQTLRSLTADGIVGELTWVSLCLATPPVGAPIYFGTGGGGTSTSGGTIYRQGDSGAAVYQIKRRMAADGLFSGTVNSEFNAELTYSVKLYQAAQGARIDGLVGPVTWSLLFPIVKKQTGLQEGAKAVQALLNLNGYSVGTPDGLFGTGSETKLKAFQSAEGLTPDGVCGAQTWEKLCEI